MVSQPCNYTKNGETAHFKWVNIMVYKLYFNKAACIDTKHCDLW